MNSNHGHIAARLRRLASGSLTGSVATLVTGTVAAQAISYAARPVLTRLFTPEAFGLLGLFLAAVAVIGPVATARYEDAIPVPRGEREAAAAATLALLISLVVTLVALLLIPARGAIASLFGRPDLAPIVALVPLGIIVVAWGRSAELWLTRRRRFRPIATARAVQSGVAVPIQIVAGIAGGGALGLAAGYLAGRAAGMIALGRAASREGRLFAEIADLSRAEVRAALHRFRKFPLFSAPSGFLNHLSMQLPAFLLLALFDPAAAGYYAVAFATLAVPMQLLGASVGQVFFSEAAGAHRLGTLGTLAGGIFRRLSAVGFFPLAALLIAAPAAFALVFGGEWREAGVYAQMIAPWMFFVFVSSPLSCLFDVLDLQDREFYFNLVLLIARLVALGVGAWLGDARLAVGLFAGVSAVFWLFHTIWMLRWSGVPVRFAGRVLRRHLLISILPLALIVSGLVLGLGDVFIVLLMLLGGLVAAALTWRFEPALR